MGLRKYSKLRPAIGVRCRQTPGPVQHMLPQRRSRRPDEVAVRVRQYRVEACGEADRHRQRGGRWARRPVTHSDTHRAVGDPEAWNAQIFDRRHMPFNPDLRCKLVHVRARLQCIRGHRIDVDRLHGAVQLDDLLLQTDRIDQLRCSLAGRGGYILRIDLGQTSRCGMGKADTGFACLALAGHLAIFIRWSTLRKAIPVISAPIFQLRSGARGDYFHLGWVPTSCSILLCTSWVILTARR
jgi:hypothetical protein